MESSEKYLLSFTAASLSISETIKIAEVYLGCKDWDETKRLIKGSNLLQSRTNTRSVRTYQEISKRLQCINDDQLELLTEGNLQEQKYLSWFVVCKRYRFIQEFAIEVIHEKFLSMDYQLTDLDYDAFYNRKADWHEELDLIKDSTKKKLKTVIFRMLREAGIISNDDLIMQAIVSNRLMDVLRSDAPESFKIFPIQEEHFQG